MRRPRNLPDSAHGFLERVSKPALKAWFLVMMPLVVPILTLWAGLRDTFCDIASAGVGAMAVQDRFADKGRIEMAQRTLRNVLAGGALVAALALAGPAPAHAAAGPGLAGFWSWLAGSWGERVATLVFGEGGAQGHRQAHGPARQDKQGVCIDPNGCANNQTTGTSTSVCSMRGDQGVCIDPNG